MTGRPVFCARSRAIRASPTARKVSHMMKSTPSSIWKEIWSSKRRRHSSAAAALPSSYFQVTQMFPATRVPGPAASRAMRTAARLMSASRPPYPIWASLFSLA